MTDLTPQIIAFLTFCQQCFYVPDNWFILGPISALDVSVGAGFVVITVWGIHQLFSKSQAGT